MEEVIKLITSYGFAAVIVAFFIIKDLRLNTHILNVLTELKTIMQYISHHTTKGELDK